MAGRTELLGDDLRPFLAGPVSMFVASVDRLCTPDVTRVVGLAPLGADRARLLISSEATVAHANLVPPRRVAVLVTDITTYRSLQWKGSVVQACSPRTPGDVALMHRHLDAFRRGAPLVGLGEQVTEGLFPVDVVALEVEVDQVFDQTPGPDAGRRIA